MIAKMKKKWKNGVNNLNEEQLKDYLHEVDEAYNFIVAGENLSDFGATYVSMDGGHLEELKRKMRAKWKNENGQLYTPDEIFGDAAQKQWQALQSELVGSHGFIHGKNAKIFNEWWFENPQGWPAYKKWRDSQSGAHANYLNELLYDDDESGMFIAISTSTTLLL